MANVNIFRQLTSGIARWRETVCHADGHFGSFQSLGDTRYNGQTNKQTNRHTDALITIIRSKNTGMVIFANG